MFRIGKALPAFENIVATDFYTAACLAFIGTALLLSQCEGARPALYQRLIAFGLIAFGALALLDYLVDKIAVPELAFFATHVVNDSRMPGSMPPDTCIGIIACGLALALMRDPGRRWACLAVQLATYIVLALGLTVLAGRVLKLELFYSSLCISRMPVSTAAALVAAGTTLCLVWSNAAWFKRRALLRPDEKLAFSGVAMLVAVAMTAGIAAVSAYHRALENHLTGSLAASLGWRVGLIQSMIASSAAHVAKLAAKPVLIDAAAALDKPVLSDAEAGEWHALAHNLAIPELAGLMLLNEHGKEIVRYGSISSQFEVDAVLRDTPGARLFWADGMFTRHTVPLVRSGVLHGYLVAQIGLPVISHLLFAAGYADTAETGLCMNAGAHLGCFPQRRNPDPYSTPRVSGNGMPVPMELAINGGKGIHFGQDYRGNHVVAAYAPVDSSGLGMVIKLDTEELFAPVRAQLERTVPVLLLLVLIGAWLLRMQIKPMSSLLVQSEREAIARENRLQAILDHVGEGIVTLDEEGTVLSFNNAASRLFGYAEADIIGSNADVLIPAHLRERHREGMCRYRETGAPDVIARGTVEVRGLHRSGAEFPLELTISAAQTGGARVFVVILRDITERRQAQAALLDARDRLEQRVAERTLALSDTNKRLEQEIYRRQAMEGRLRRKSERIIEMAAHQERIKEDERKRIAREIHDELGGLLTGIKSYLSFAIDKAQAQGQAPDVHLKETSLLADCAIETVRRVITDLRPSVLDQLGLWAALEWSAGQVQERAGLRCIVQIDDASAAVDVDPELSTTIFRIVQETLTNVVRHARASTVDIVARCGNGIVRIEVRDNGIGIAASDLIKQTSWGIVGMHERARYLGGNLTVARHDSGGTVVVLELPLRQEHV